MHVIAHQAIQVHPHPMLPRLLAQLIENPPAIPVIVKYPLSAIPANGHVVDRSLKYDSQFPRHTLLPPRSNPSIPLFVICRSDPIRPLTPFGRDPLRSAATPMNDQQVMLERVRNPPDFAFELVLGMRTNRP
jgi:hypothetical protein